MKRVKLTVAYDGTNYCGWQVQPNGLAVQEVLNRCLSEFLGTETEVIGASRTDAGVHALGQVVSCVLDETDFDGVTPGRLTISLNALTPDDIVIKAVDFARSEFSARFDATTREYRYRIVTGPVPPLFLSDFAWWRRGELDIEAMCQGAAHLIGEHDFKSFCKAASAEGKTTMRRVDEISITHEEQMGESCLLVKVVGNAFLHSMVRTIVGTLVQVGAGTREPGWVADVLAARDRGAAGETAPACGLTFWHVNY